MTPPPNQSEGREAMSLLSAFGQGRAAGEGDGFPSDNPHPYESKAWYAWVAGFEEERRQFTVMLRAAEEQG